MATEFYNATCIRDAVGKDKRRSRHILAASGLVLESGETRDLENLYVMGRNGQLYRIGDLAQDPDKQTEDYTVKAQADHGELQDGERVPSIKNQFGSCKVWLDDDGQLHAKMYFADNDELADHAYAISEDASYSMGADWFVDGYYGAGQAIDHSIGILREISMVLTGNDPRAYTIDTKQAKAQRSADGGIIKGKAEADAEARRSADEESGARNNGVSKMIKKTDELTPDENGAIKARLGEAISKAVEDVVNNFTADVPESETQPTASDTKTKDEEGEGEKSAESAPAEKTSDALRSPVVVVRTGGIKQERTSDAVSAYLKSEKSVAAFGQALLDAKGAHNTVGKLFAKIAKTRDGVDFGENVELAPEMVINAVAEQMNDEDSILSHVFRTGLNYEVVAVPTSEDGPRGHVRGRTKIEENITGATRVLTPADFYKLMRLDHSMVEINGGLGSSAIVRYVLREMPRKLREGIDQSILVGGVKNDDANETNFTALIPVVNDIADSTTSFATTFAAAGATLTRADISKAASRVTSGANRTLVMTQDDFTDLENATTGSAGVPVFPNGINKANPGINGIARIITPMWLTSDMLGDNLAVVVDLDAYHTVGKTDPETLTDYAIDTNKYVWEVLALIGGGLANANAAVGITAAGASA